MFQRRVIAVVIIILLLTAVAWVWASASTVDQNGVLSGKVSASGLVTAGEFVKEGQVLVNIETITGLTPAARANVDGKVVEVYVKPGDTVKAGQVLVRIEKAGK